MTSDREPAATVPDDSVTEREEGNPHQVGKTKTRGGEEVAKIEGKEAGRVDAGTQGPTNRPVGTSTPRDKTGIDP